MSGSLLAPDEPGKGWRGVIITVLVVIVLVGGGYGFSKYEAKKKADTSSTQSNLPPVGSPTNGQASSTPTPTPSASAVQSTPTPTPTVDQKVYQVNASGDAAALAQQVSLVLGNYTWFGNQGCTPSTCLIRTTPDGRLSFSPMQGAEGIADYSRTGPGTTTVRAALTNGSLLSSGSFAAGADLRWCIVVRNHDAYSKYTDQGFGGNSLSTPLTCENGR